MPNKNMLSPESSHFVVAYLVKWSHFIGRDNEMQKNHVACPITELGLRQSQDQKLQKMPVIMRITACPPTPIVSTALEQTCSSDIQMHSHTSHVLLLSVCLTTQCRNSSCYIKDQNVRIWNICVFIGVSVTCLSLAHTYLSLKEKCLIHCLWKTLRASSQEILDV